MLSRAQTVPHTGAQLVDLEILIDGRPLVTLSIVRLWKASTSKCMSIFCVASAGRLNGVLLSMLESEVPHATEVIVRPRNACRPYPVHRSRLDDPVLGSDFVYEDLKLFPPRMLSLNDRDVAYNAATDRRTCRIRYNFKETVPVCVEASLTKRGLLVDATWKRQVDDVRIRELVVSEVVDQAGFEAPSIMTISRNRGYSSRLVLRDSRYDFPVDELANLDEVIYLAEGWRLIDGFARRLLPASVGSWPR